VTIDDLATLLGIATAIKEGDITPEEAFAEDVPAKPMPGEPQAKKPEGGGQAEAKPQADGPADSAPATEPKSGEFLPREDARPAAEPSKAMPATEGDLKLIRKKMAEATVTERELCRKYQIKALDAAHVDTELVRVILTWLKNPGE